MRTSPKFFADKDLEQKRRSLVGGSIPPGATMIDSSKLHVCMVYNDTFNSLAVASCNSYCHKNIIVHLKKLNIPENNNDTLWSADWYDSLREKVSFSNDVFKRMAYGDVICVSDADVYCLNSDNVYNLRKELIDNDLDMISLSDHFKQYYAIQLTDRLKINCGFIVMRKTARSESFFDKILSYNFKDFGFAEQDIVNEVILRQDHGLRYKTLSPTEYVLGCYLNRILSIRELKVSLIHTTCTSNVRDKQNQIDKLLQACNIEPVDWLNSTIYNEQVLHY